MYTVKAKDKEYVKYEDNEQLKNYYFGAYSFSETEDGYLQAFQYTADQMKYFEEANDFWYDRCMASTAKTIEMVTDATKVSFDYKFFWTGSQDSFELCINGLADSIVYVKDIDTEGYIEWDMPEGEKSVVIYLPADATVLIKNFEINSEAKRTTKNERVLWLGDSITQGFGPLRSAQTYVSVANRILNYDVIYMLGGNVGKLIELNHNTNIKELIIKFLEKGIYIGESAGSMILSKDVKYIYDLKKGTSA